MSLSQPERLYRLLPPVYRGRDADQGEPLRALLGVIEDELERVEADIAGVHDNWFIETCDEWVLPYIGDLLGVRPIQPIPSAGVSVRAYVANTIAYRRRKGTAVVLEQLARDVTGWPARAVECFQRVATAQHMNHVRAAPSFTANIRDASAAELADGPFEGFAHTAEVRRIATRSGRYNLPNVGLYLWRLKSYTLGEGSPGDAAPDFSNARALGRMWSLHPVGVDAPLFNRPRTESTITHLAEEENVPGELRGLVLHAELERLRRGMSTPAPRFMTEHEPVLRVFVRLDGESLPVEVQREDIYLCEMPNEIELASPPPRALALDPQRGRMAFPAALPVQEAWVQCSHGFSGDLGGGPYDRNAAVRNANVVAGSEHTASGGFDDSSVWQVGVSHLTPDNGNATVFPTLRTAVQAWNAEPAGRNGVIVLMDSLSEFDADAAGSPASALEIELGERSQLLIVAGLWPLEPIPGAPPGSVARVPGRIDASSVRPHYIGDIVIRGTATSSQDAGACFVNGLLLEGQLIVALGNLGRLDIAHSTLVPRHGGLTVPAGGNERLQLVVDHSICASIDMAGPIAALTIVDSIIESGDNVPSSPQSASVIAPDATAEFLRSSFFGDVFVQSVNATDCLFAAEMQAMQRQSGCVRFSYVTPGSRVPRRYRCQPELAVATGIAALRERASAQNSTLSPSEEAAVRIELEALIRPLFVSRQFGDPGYAQLERRCAPEISTGAESGAEMGAFEFLRQPQRKANLATALDEYLRFGLEAGTLFVT